MDKESYGQHIIFIIILCTIVFLSYCLLPSTQPLEMTHKTSKKAQTKIDLLQKDERAIVPEKVVVKEAIVKQAVVAETKGEAQKVEKVAQISGNGDKTLQIDVIPMDNPLYKVHKKGIVQFTHQNHVEKYLISCGSCHHDETGKPLELTFNDTPKGCIECHKGTEKPKGEKLGKKEKIMKYHFEALHANCIDCHKDYNKKNGDPKGKKPAPTSCTACHPKK